MIVLSICAQIWCTTDLHCFHTIVFVHISCHGPQDEALVDKGQHDAPFDVTEVPHQLATGDPHAQVDVHLALYPTQGPTDNEYVHLFNIHHMKHISLGALQHLHNNQQAMSVITLLSKRHKLRLDNKDHVDVMANPNLVPHLAPHYLDYTLYVGSHHRLDAALPNVDIDHNWTAKLQLSMANQFWPFNAINSLPFDPKGHMIFDQDPGFLNCWHPWVAAAPQSWKVDGFLTQNAPVGITLWYDLEHHNWDHDCKYTHIHQVSFSLATHISYLNVNGWSAIDRALIQWANPVIYDKPDDDPTWEQVDLADLPLVDEDGFEINVYNPDGFHIPRQKPTSFKTCGALLDLKKVHELFQGTEDAHRHVQNEVPFTVYPLAVTQDLGNVKATGLMLTFACRVMQLNAAIREDDRAARCNVDDDDDDNNNPMIPNCHSPALLGISSQIYNSLSHHVHTEAKFHVVQLGMVTSAFAGSSAKSVTGKHHWERQVKFCEQGMPHVRFSQQVSGDRQPQTLRFENTYILDISRMHPNLHTGR
ncbi:hypothetical protein EDC04DRAFT_2606295 [Pisolithus marmoratus]|nr:hypothetical protein EDC04DRAFT_2606295 [Pisolithus marmoratus]